MFQDFEKARKLAEQKELTFESLLMAAVRIAPTGELAKLRKAFPALVGETIARGNTHDGKLASDFV